MGISTICVTNSSDMQAYQQNSLRQFLFPSRHFSTTVNITNYDH